MVGRKSLIWAGAIVGGLALLAGCGAYVMRDQIAFANIAVGYAAKQTCSCLHVAERTQESCLAELPAEAQGQITLTTEGQRVRASAFMGAFSAMAVHEAGYGCRIE